MYQPIRPQTAANGSPGCAAFDSADTSAWPPDLPPDCLLLLPLTVSRSRSSARAREQLETAEQPCRAGVRRQGDGGLLHDTALGTDSEE